MEKRKISKKECSRIIRNDCMVIVVLVVLTVFIGVKNTKANEVEPVEAIGEVVTEIPIEEQELEDVPKEPRMISEQDKYVLAKIAMAEAEGEDTKGKALVMAVVINRTEHQAFPETISEVVFAKGQFTPVRNGRYQRVEPSEDCYAALKMIENGWDESQGALYFEASTAKSTWHSRNLTELYTHGGHTFYTHKE